MFLVDVVPACQIAIALRLNSGAVVVGQFVRRYEQEKGGVLWTLTVNGAVQSFSEAHITAWSPA